MRITAIVAFVAISMCLVSGCRKPPRPYGNFAKTESADLVQDAVNALRAAYPPVKSRFALLRPVEDGFGFSLIEAIRGNGYAVAEYSPPGKGGKAPAISDAPGGLGFGYTLDALREGGGLRVTLYVGDETLSRLYAIRGEKEDTRYIPAGSWVRREGAT